MNTVLATAYAINPTKGSEDAMGWNFILQIARFQNVVAITRENNKEGIEKFMKANPNECYKRIQFVYFDLPYYLRFWKKGGRGAMLYFVLWQYAIVPFIKKQKLSFDVVHNVNFHNDWTPSYLWKLGKPFVWGPIGHHPLIPKIYLKNFASKAFIKDRGTWLIKKIFWNVSSGLRKSVTRANHIWLMNSSVEKVLPIDKMKSSISPSVATEDFCPNWTYNPQEKFVAVSIGRFVPLKGFDLSIDAFAAFCRKLSQEQVDNCVLMCIGTGPEESFLRDRAAKSGFSKQIQFIKWMPRTELVKLYEKASVFLFPSHEGAGMVVPEAMSFGLPIVCLDNIGPGEFITPACGLKVKMVSYEQTVNDLSNCLYLLQDDNQLLMKMSQAAREHFTQHFLWDRRGEKLNRIYNQVLTSTVS